MYVLEPGIKRDPVRRWNLPDRIFFGHGACHILAGVFLLRFDDRSFHPLWVRPEQGAPGTHVFVTDGVIAFDYHGYSLSTRLLEHHRNGWSRLVPGWSARLVEVDFPLLDTVELNARRMLGPGQYFGGVVERAARYLDRIDHPIPDAARRCRPTYGRPLPQRWSERHRAGTRQDLGHR
jgi:hypothetical protein